MATKWCEDCGTPHECEVIDGEKADLAIARVWANRDIEVARLNAGAAKDIATVEAEHSAEHAEGVAEGMETVLDAGQTEPEAEGGDIVVDTEAEGEPEAEPEAEAEPEVVEVPEPAQPKRGGYWGAYR